MDLGEEWTRRTGLPFVWAFWAGRPGVATRDDVERLQAALKGGLEALAEIAWSYNGAGPARGPRNEAYLRSNIAYALGEAELAALREFFRKAHVMGLIPAVPELRFYVHP